MHLPEGPRQADLPATAQPVLCPQTPLGAGTGIEEPAASWEYQVRPADGLQGRIDDFSAHSWFRQAVNTKVFPSAGTNLFQQHPAGFDRIEHGHNILLVRRVWRHVNCVIRQSRSANVFDTAPCGEAECRSEKLVLACRSAFKRCTQLTYLLDSICEHVIRRQIAREQSSSCTHKTFAGPVLAHYTKIKQAEERSQTVVVESPAGEAQILSSLASVCGGEKASYSRYARRLNACQPCFGCRFGHRDVG